MSDAERDEAALAQQALDKIQAWAKKIAAAGGKMPPRLAIKFCGGCNPVIERGVVARIIRESLSVKIKWVAADEEEDLLIILSGCLTSCADRPEVCARAVEALNISCGMVSEIKRGGRGSG